MIVTGHDIVREAQSWKGTPWQHQGRSKGLAVDCVGLLVGIAAKLRLPHMDRKAYARYPRGNELLDLLRDQMDEIRIAAPGDVLALWMRQRGIASHVAVRSDHGIIHACNRRKMVIEHTLDARWRERIVASFRYRRN